MDFYFIKNYYIYEKIIQKVLELEKSKSLISAQGQEVLSYLYEIDAPIPIMLRANRIMESGRKNRGFTFVNPHIKKAVVVVGPTTSSKQFLNTFTHESRHLADAIAKSMGYELNSEEPAYLTGDTTMALAETICELGCPCRDKY